MTEPARADLRTRLRAETADAHRALEEALDLRARLFERDAIVRVLCGLRGFFAPAERSLDAALGPAMMRGRHRVPALDADLGALGLDPSAIHLLPVCSSAAEARSPAAALGCLYVLEGTRLGGRVIGGALAGATWVPAGFSQFWSDRPDGGRHWQSFLALLAEEREETAVIDGAAATFELIRRWLGSVGATVMQQRDAAGLHDGGTEAKGGAVPRNRGSGMGA